MTTPEEEMDAKYITNCWREFTRLTPLELENLAEMKKVQEQKLQSILKRTNPDNRKKKVLCKETGEIFESIYIAAKYFNVHRTNIRNCIKYGWKVKKQYTLEYTNKEIEKKKILWITL